MYFRKFLTALSVCGLLAAMQGRPAIAWTNLLKDPGFEEYRLDPRGFYTPGPNAAWKEITLGRCSVQFNANTWKALAEMTAERPLGFTPGTTGFQGMGPTENKGRLIMQQDILEPGLLSRENAYYEAWIWLGGGGRDDDKSADLEDEAGGWEIYFYNNTDPSTWQESNAIEMHSMTKDFWGEPGSFVQVAGYGRIPAGAKGARMRIHAATWATASKPAKHDTEVAIDNAHFAIIGAPNMLINGDFEMDVREGEMKGWSCPAAWPFGRTGMRPRDINNSFGENFDHGTFRPFYGGKWAYGYATYLDGWRKDGFSFGQYADYRFKPGTPLALMLHWIQNAASGAEPQLRVAGTELEVVVECLRGPERLAAKAYHVDWPVPRGPAAVGRYDQNAGRPYCPRFLVQPPPGTDRVGVHVNFIVNMPYRDGWRSVDAAVDEFYLGPVDLPEEEKPPATSSSPAGSH